MPCSVVRRSGGFEVRKGTWCTDGTMAPTLVFSCYFAPSVQRRDRTTTYPEQERTTALEPYTQDYGTRARDFDHEFPGKGERVYGQQ